ncbi:MAG: DUF503 domain-containing protein [Candidatus Eiseniibacteriota bacterium]|jgi:hypothetical protein
MIIGTARIEMHIPGAGSLKQKRAVVRSLKERMISRLRVSAAEVDHLDLWQRATLGVAVVGGDRRTVNSVLTRAVRLCEGEMRVSVIDVVVEIL